MDSYYGVDLVTILEKGDIDAFKYLYGLSDGEVRMVEGGGDL